MDEDEISVQVTDVRFDGSSIAIGIGRHVDTGETVRFGGDSRPMRDIAEAIEAGEEPVATVPLWAVLGG